MTDVANPATPMQLRFYQAVVTDATGFSSIQRVLQQQDANGNWLDVPLIVGATTE